MDRHTFLQKTENEHFDICIIGGGASGAGCALDAQARGLKTILIEKKDFGAATSSKSTKLIHGGVRYLEQAVKKLSIEQYRMVRKALKERKTILHIAPHITHPLQIVTPCRTWLESIYYFAGLKLYDWISGGANIGNSHLLNRKQALSLIPNLKKSNLFNAVTYYDGQMDDQRLNLALIQTAVAKGAVCLNHCSANAFEKNEDQKIQSLQVTDKLTGKAFTIRAKVFINATGPFADTIRLMANENLKQRIRVSKGIHILLPRHMMVSSSALLIPKTRDGRLIFVIPYQQHLLVGTTEDECKLTTDEFGPTKAEIKYLLEYVNDYLDVDSKPSDVLAGFGGLRPLITSEGSTKDLVRDHEVEFDSVSGLVSILGGKWTTYRLMGKDTIDKAEAILFPGQDSPRPSFTENIILEGSLQFDAGAIKKELLQQGWQPDMIEHLVKKYGTNARSISLIAEQDAAGKTRLLDGMPYTKAELQYTLQNEMCFTIKDVLGRRWGIQLSNWQQTIALIPVVGKLMSDYFKWTAAEEAAYIDNYTNEMEAMIRNSGG